MSQEQLEQRLLPTPYQWIVGAVEGGELAGMLGFVRERSDKLQHKALLWGMYVNPAFQGRGIGSCVMKETIRRAAAMPEVERLQLAVGVTNEPAIRLYRSAGFVVYATEPDAMRVDGQPIDEYWMAFDVEAYRKAGALKTP